MQYRLLVYGGIALLVILLFPDGLVGSIARWRRRRLAPSDLHDFRLDRFLARKDADAAEAAACAREVVVEVKQGGKAFGRVVALDGVDLNVQRGEVHGLVGANGSGKTSLLNVLAGLSRLDSGSLHVERVDISHLPAHRIARLGIGRTFQTPRIFGEMSVWENLQIGLDARAGSGVVTLPLDLGEAKRRFSAESAKWLPHGQRRLVEVMRVVLKDAQILLLDEPAAGLSPAERKEFGALIHELRRRGKTIVLVEHDLDLVWGVADRVTVLDAGKVVAHGAPQEIARHA